MIETASSSAIQCAAVEELVVADFGCGGFVFDGGVWVFHFDVGEGVGAALFADEQ